jgi:hypothetical protein
MIVVIIENIDAIGAAWLPGIEALHPRGSSVDGPLRLVIRNLIYSTSDGRPFNQEDEVASNLMTLTRNTSRCWIVCPSFFAGVVEAGATSAVHHLAGLRHH